MPEPIQERLESLSGDLLPIRQLAERLLDPAAQLDPDSGNISISQRPMLGPEAYAVVLYAGITEHRILYYLNSRPGGLRGQFIIPSTYLRILDVLNGAELYQLRLYGLPPSMCAATPPRHRSTRQPLDLGAANFNWSRQYRSSPSQFHFGSGPYSYEENLAYFLNADDTVEARRVGGSLFGTWPSFAPFLEAEISRAESLFPAHEARTERLQQSIVLNLNPRFRD
ncbi:MAG TPA: hypothetical protein VHZ25_17175 [Acidobacteriaceae bacterium]|jgi:hypothetical protein|nr:hypothetical protein [Acidobacteriaceae bacterium]